MIEQIFDAEVLTENAKALFYELCDRLGWEVKNGTSVCVPPNDEPLFEFITEGL